MRRTFVAIALFIASLGAVVARAAEVQDELRVNLEIAPQSTLPGIPVTFRIIFTNPAEVPVTLPVLALIVATDDTGVSFVVWPKPIFPRDLWTAPVPAGASAVIELRPHGSFNDGSSFVEDLRLNRPGQFRFHVVAGKFTSDERFFTVPEDGIRSPDVLLHVVEPVGVDLDAWREILKNQQGQWARVWDPGNPAISARIVRRFPDSQYAGWIAASGISAKFHENADALRAWLSRVNRDQYTEARELKLALFDDTAARQWTLITEDEVLRHLRSARALLERLKDSKDPRIASRAAKQLMEVAESEENARERGPRVP
jgi:hypothetical protein